MLPFEPPPIQGLLGEEVRAVLSKSFAFLTVVIDQNYQDDQSLLFFTWAKAAGNTRARHRVATENIAIVNDMILLMR